MEIFYYLGALTLGLVIGFLISRLHSARTTVLKSEHESIESELVKAKLELAARPTKEELTQAYVVKDAHDIVLSTLQSTQGELESHRTVNQELSTEIATLRGKEDGLKEKIKLFETQIENSQEQARTQFKTLASEILEEKSKVFSSRHAEELENILSPLKKDLGDFKTKIEDTRKEDIRELTSLKSEIETLGRLNTTLHQDAQNLTNALRSDIRVQGDFGDDRLKLILEAEGLQNHIDFTSQASFLDSDEEKRFRPDYVLNLPDKKHLVIDSKVSLTAYVKYFAENDPDTKKRLLKDHLKSVTDHIDKLADKNYQALLGLNTPDYVLMFMPVESALTLALNENAELLNRAFKKKIVITTPSTLVATLKIVKTIWQKEKRVNNVEKIFEECGKLYDKFVAFVGEMERVGSGLNSASNAYHDAMNSLSQGQRKGSTIMGRFERIRELEASTNKLLSQKYLAHFDEEDETSNTAILSETTTTVSLIELMDSEANKTSNTRTELDGQEIDNEPGW